MYQRSGFRQFPLHDKKKLELAIVQPTFHTLSDHMGNFDLKSREGQEDMALDIAEAVAKRQHLMVEAGVGIGKSLGYLIPAMYALKALRKSIIVATSSIQLSEQLMNDAETAKKVTDSTDVNVVLGKGMAHYSCVLRTIDNEKKISPELRKWILEDGGGDRSDCPPHILDNEWKMVNVDNCRFEECKFHKMCSFFNMRQSLNTVVPKLLIVNQDLLLAHLLKKHRTGYGFITNQIGMIVVDEAHNLEDKTRNALTNRWTYHSLRQFLSAVESSISKYPGLSFHQQDLRRLRRSLDSMFTSVLEQIERMKYENTRLKAADRFSFKFPKSFSTHDWFNTLQGISIGLSMEEEHQGRRNKRVFSESLFERMNEAMRLVENVETDLYWIEMSKNHKTGITICSAPKNLADQLRYTLFSQAVPVILTSATLCASGDSNEEKYHYRRVSLGFDGNLADPKPSPFPYDENACLYVPSDIVEHRENHDQFLNQVVERIVQLCHITCGRAMVLFTAKDELQFVYEKLSELDLPWRLHRQAEGASQTDVIEEFRRSKGVLLGTGVFWEGVNIQGSDLSSVIIVRLPFPVPDPIIEYKISQNKDRYNVLLPEMLFKLRQGAGRLIRSETDTGILTILDSRVSSMSQRPYRHVTLKSLPIKKLVESLEDVREFAVTKIVPKFP